VKINNLPDTAKNRKYIVFRYVDDEAWFYDAWDDHTKALAQAVEINGQFIPTEYVEV
jgi:hypothetical protein